MKVSEKNPAVVADQRSDSTLDTLDQIANEELQENAELAASVERQEQAAIEAQSAECAASWREALKVAGDLTISMFPRVSAVWTNEWMDRESEALARCFPDGAGVLFGNPWFGLAITTAPVAFQVARIVREDLEAAEERKRLEKLRRAKEGAQDVEPKPAMQGAGQTPFGG